MKLHRDKDLSYMLFPTFPYPEVTILPLHLLVIVCSDMCIKGYKNVTLVVLCGMTRYHKDSEKLKMHAKK